MRRHWYFNTLLGIATTKLWKPWSWMRLYLILSKRDMKINWKVNPLTKFRSSNRSTFTFTMTIMIMIVLGITFVFHAYIGLTILNIFPKNKNKGLNITSLLCYQEIPRKLKQDHDQNFPMEERNGCRRQNCEYCSHGSD